MPDDPMGSAARIPAGLKVAIAFQAQAWALIGCAIAGGPALLGGALCFTMLGTLAVLCVAL